MDFLACVDNDFRTGATGNKVMTCNRVLHVTQNKQKMQWQNTKHFEEKKFGASQIC